MNVQLADAEGPLPPAAGSTMAPHNSIVAVSPGHAAGHRALMSALCLRSEGDRVSGLVADVLGDAIVVSSSSAFIER